MGRPTDYTEEIADYICDKISLGTPLAEICREKNMPHRTTVYDWKDKYPEFSLRFARAREAGFDAIADDCLKIADDHTRDVQEIEVMGVKTQSVDYEVIQRSKLRVETRLKLLSKWSPAKYGEKLDVTTGGGPINDKLPIVKLPDGTILEL